MWSAARIAPLVFFLVFFRQTLSRRDERVVGVLWPNTALDADSTSKAVSGHDTPNPRSADSDRSRPVLLGSLLVVEDLQVAVEGLVVGRLDGHGVGAGLDARDVLG